MKKYLFRLMGYKSRSDLDDTIFDEVEAEDLESAKALMRIKYPGVSEGNLGTGAEFIEKYKNSVIASWGESIITISENGCRFIVALDDSKSCGYRKDIPGANNVESAREYIDWHEGATNAVYEDWLNRKKS